MLISTKGRYALRIMLDLAQQEPGPLFPFPQSPNGRRRRKNIWRASSPRWPEPDLLKGSAARAAAIALRASRATIPSAKFCGWPRVPSRRYPVWRQGHSLPEGQLLPDAAGLGKIRVPDLWLSRRSHADKPARRRRRDRRLPKREKVNILCCFHKPIDKVGFCAMINP